jgi:hypothetical protein
MTTTRMRLHHRLSPRSLISPVSGDQPAPSVDAGDPSPGWSHRTDIRRETVLSGASAGLGHVPGVAAVDDYVEADRRHHLAEPGGNR